MLYLKDEYFENTDFRELNMWSTSYGGERAPRDQLLGFRFLEACEKFKVKNALALWVYGATVTSWFSRAPKDRYGQVRWCEALASEYARLGDIRLLPLTEDERVIMTLVWTQASARLNEYAKFKKPVEPKLPTKPEPMPQPKPVENGGKKEAEKEPEKKSEPIPTDKESTVEVEDKKTMWRRLIGSIAGALSFVVDKIPIPLPIKYVVKIILTAIATFFK
jgi:hypothetical protein